MNVCLFCWVLSHMTTSSAFTGGGKPQMPLHALLQARVGTWAGPLTLAGLLPHMKESNVHDGFRTHGCDDHVIRYHWPKPLGHGRPMKIFSHNIISNFTVDLKKTTNIQFQHLSLSFDINLIRVLIMIAFFNTIVIYTQ